MNLFSFFLVLSFFLSISLSMFKSPSSLAAGIVFLSGVLVSIMSLSSSYWFSYVLFLVYVGGLLVMFIYVCLVSSNFPYSINFGRGLLSIGLAGIMVESVTNPEIKSFLGISSFSGASSLLDEGNLSLFVFLTVLLLVMLFVVVRSVGGGSLKIDA